MREFFRGWRRKLGVLTLLMTCVFAAGWVRSLYVRDEIVFVRGHSYNRVLSLSGTIGWGGVHGPHPLDGFFQGGHSQPVTPNESSHPVLFGWLDWLGEGDPEAERSWDHSWGGLIGRLTEYGFLFVHTRDPSDVRSALWVIPYWFLVLPLTLLSAWLLLNKRRPAKRSPESS